nr:MAG TPA: hypothetical protein [Caudoviricetes sp.]
MASEKARRPFSHTKLFAALSSTKIQLHYEKFNKVTKRYQTQNSKKLVFSMLFYTM